jgi:hypothetical protein
MGKLIYILIPFLLFINSCNDDVIVDGLQQGKYFFRIVNNTDLDVKIECNYSSMDGIKNDTIRISSYDSINIEPHTIGFNYEPFPAGTIYLVFDDSIRYLCSKYMLDEKYKSCELMFLITNNYNCILNGPDIHLYRYEITEKEYEYAKAHPYKLNEE